MNGIFIRVYSRLLQIIVRIFCKLTGKGGGKFAKFLPKGQNFLIPNYCGNLNFEVDTTYPMESSVWLAGVYDVTTTNFLKKVIHPDDVVLDIGANCGALTLVVASLIDQGKIYAFEPAPAVRSRLQGNVELNPKLKEIVTVLPYGLGRHNYKGFYNEDPNYRGNGSLHGQQGIAVEVFSLDEWVALEKLDKIDVIKIDVEGMEYDVLMGGKAVLEKYHPILYFETLEIFFATSSHSIKDTYEFLSSLGYRIIYPTASYSEIPFEGPYPPNSVAIHSSKAARLRK